MIYDLVNCAIANDFYGRLKVIKGTTQQFHYLNLRCTAYIMYDVNYNGPMLFVSNYLYCHIQLEGLFCDAEHDVLVVWFDENIQFE